MTPDLIIIGGAPGSGKTTISELLRHKLDAPMIDYGWLREFHLKRDWSNASEREEQMSFENLIAILRNYSRYGYKNVIVNDLRDFRIQQIPNLFAANTYAIITLTVAEEDLRRRVSARSSGFQNVENALAWNRAVLARPTLNGEHKLDNTTRTPEEMVGVVLGLVGG